MEFEEWILQQDPKDVPSIRKEVDTKAFWIFHERFDSISTPVQQLNDTKSAQEIVMMDKDKEFFGYKRKPT